MADFHQVTRHKPPEAPYEGDGSPSVNPLGDSDRHSTTLFPRPLSEDILNAIKEHNMNRLLTLVLHSELIEHGKSRKPPSKHIPTNYQSLSEESIEVLDFDFHSDYKEKIAHAVSVYMDGYLPVHRMVEMMVKDRSPTGKGFSMWTLAWKRHMTLQVCLKLLGGFNGAGSGQYWRQMQPDGKNALHIAASGHNFGSDLAVRIILELLALSQSESSSSSDMGLDDLTAGPPDGTQEHTALHLAMPKLWTLKFQGHSLERLLLAGANPCIQNSPNGETLLHLLASKERSDGDHKRLHMIKTVLQHKEDGWKINLTAKNHVGYTAMAKAFEFNDYDMVIALLKTRASSINLSDEAQDIWARDKADVLSLALDPDGKFNSLRGSLIQALAHDDVYLFRKKDSAMAALEKACNLTEDRDDVVSALLNALHDPDKTEAFSRGCALSLAARKDHSLTVSVMLDHGAVEHMRSAECFSLIKTLRDEGRTMLADLIQYFRTHSRVNVLEQSSDSETLKDLKLFAIKWPRRLTSSPNYAEGERDKEHEIGEMGEDKNGSEKQRRVGFSMYCRKEGAQAFSTFKYSLYSSQHPVGQILHCEEHTFLHTWTRRNGGWIHLPANNVSTCLLLTTKGTMNI